MKNLAGQSSVFQIHLVLLFTCAVFTCTGNTEMFNEFEAICAWLEEEGNCDLHTINELQKKIKLMGY